MDADAHAASDGGEIRVFTVRTFAFAHLVGFKVCFAIFRFSVRSDSDSPCISGFFGYPTGVEKRSFAATMGTDHLPCEEVCGHVFLIKLENRFRNFVEMFFKRFLFPGRNRSDIRKEYGKFLVKPGQQFFSP